MFKERLALYRELEQEFNSKIITYVTSDRPNMAAQIASDAIEYFISHLDSIGPCSRISLFLYTRGGDTSAARNIVNLLRMYCDYLQVIIPHKAHSAGTIIALGANEMVMTKQATLRPIDPSLHTLLNPRAQDGTLYPVSVEAVKGYLEFAKNELGITDQATLGDIFKKLSDFVHPLVLGEVYRSKAQIQMMAEKLLLNQVTDPEKVKKVTDFLCSDSGSHDYTINRREAKNELGLNVNKPTPYQYDIIKSIYLDINEELCLNVPFSFHDINGIYAVRRCLLESVEGGSDYFSTEGVVEKGKTPDGQAAIHNQVVFEGWRHETAPNHMIIKDSVEQEEIVYEHSSEYKV